LSFGENTEGNLAALAGRHRGVRKGVEDSFDTTSGRLACSEVKIGSTTLFRFFEKLKNI
jgi:hypothetical protein